MKSNSQRIAESISLALNPFFLLPFVFIIALFLTHFPTFESQIKWVGVIFVANMFAPFLWISYLDYRGVVVDDTLAHHKLHRQRLKALIPIIIIIAFEIILMLIFQKYNPLFAVFISSFTVSVISGIISYFWKISAHMIGISTTITLLTLLLGTWVLWSAVFIPAIVWARLKLHRHTLLQLIVGFVVPPIVILTVFSYFNLVQ